MKNEILFTEGQKFKQWWFWINLIEINGLCHYGVYKQVILGLQFGDKPLSNTGLLIAIGLTLFLTTLLINLKFHAIVKNDGI